MHALNNEVVHTEFIVAQLATVSSERTSLIEEAEQQETLELLNQARVALNQLQDILEGFTGLCDRSKFRFIQARAWRKEQPKVKRLQDDIKRVKYTLGEMLKTSNSYEQPFFHVNYAVNCKGQVVVDMD